MDKKKIRRSIGRFFGWIGLISVASLAKIIPQKWLYGCAKIIATLAYRIAHKKREIALESLATAFGQGKSPQEIERIAKDCFIFLAKAGMEIIFLMDRPPLLKKRVQILGKENLDAVLAKGKGAILVTAHFGNFPLMYAKLSLEGYPTAGIMRFMRDERAEKFFTKKRNKVGIKTIYSQPRKECVENSIRTLRDNGLLVIPLDQNFGSGGVFVNFFGKKAATATGPVVLARRTAAAILPCFIVRQQDDTHQLIFEPPLELEKGDSDEEGIVINVQKVTNIIESYIRRYPAEWGWIHRRWKSQSQMNKEP